MFYDPQQEFAAKHTHHISDKTSLEVSTWKKPISAPKHLTNIRMYNTHMFLQLQQEKKQWFAYTITMTNQGTQHISYPLYHSSLLSPTLPLPSNFEVLRCSRDIPFPWPCTISSWRVEIYSEVAARVEIYSDGFH